MRSFNGQHMANFKSSHSFSVSPKEQIEIYAASTQTLTLAGDAVDEQGVIRPVILKTGTHIELKAIFENFTCLRITAPSPSVKFGLLVKTAARQLEEPHDPSAVSLFASLPEKTETGLQRMIKSVTGYGSESRSDLQPQSERGTMEPEDFPWTSHISDDVPDIFDDTPQDAHTPQASDPAVQPQGEEAPVPEAQPSPPTDNNSGNK